MQSSRSAVAALLCASASHLHDEHHAEGFYCLARTVHCLLVVVEACSWSLLQLNRCLGMWGALMSAVTAALTSLPLASCPAGHLPELYSASHK